MYSRLVASRHFFLAHGVGRSGDLTAQQPKAIGSSLLQALTTALTLSAVHAAGMQEMKEALLMPCATGLSLTLTLLALRSSNPQARYVLMPRIDQRTCIKAVQQAQLEPLLVPNALASAHTVTDVERLRAAIASLPPQSVLCVVSVTSCFAPRTADDVVAIAKLCRAHALPHVVNHAYGLQSRAVCEDIDRACRRGRVDAVVQSMDKNFLVPVGGAIITAPAPPPLPPPSSSFGESPQSAAPAPPPLLRRIASLYPGRASSSSISDLLVTLLAMGESGYRGLLTRRVALFASMQSRLSTLAERHGERLLQSPNDVSMAITITITPATGGASPTALHLGAMLYSRGVSGMRLVLPGKTESVGDVRLEGWGGHGWPGAYLSMACALGMDEDEVARVLDKLDRCLSEWRASNARREERTAQDSAQQPQQPHLQSLSVPEPSVLAPREDAGGSG